MNFYNFQKNIKSNKKAWMFPALFFLLYIVLFQFILPPDLFLPKPQLLIDTVISLESEYNFLSATGWSVLFVYVAIFIFVILSFLSGSVLLRLSHKYPSFFHSFKFLSYVPFLIIAILFSYWFNSGLEGEFWLLFSVVLLYAPFFITKYKDKVKENHYYLAKTFELSEADFYRGIAWKNIMPKFYDNIEILHLNIWSYALLIEFIYHENGLGSIIRSMFEYRDLSGLLTLIILLFLIIAIGAYILNFLKNKIINWEA